MSLAGSTGNAVACNEEGISVDQMEDGRGNKGGISFHVPREVAGRKDVVIGR